MEWVCAFIMTGEGKVKIAIQYLKTGGGRKGREGGKKQIPFQLFKGEKGPGNPRVNAKKNKRGEKNSHLQREGKEKGGVLLYSQGNELVLRPKSRGGKGGSRLLL